MLLGPYFSKSITFTQHLCCCHSRKKYASHGLRPQQRDQLNHPKFQFSWSYVSDSKLLPSPRQTHYFVRSPQWFFSHFITGWLTRPSQRGLHSVLPLHWISIARFTILLIPLAEINLHTSRGMIFRRINHQAEGLL